MRKEFRQRLAEEYRYAATKVAEAQEIHRKLFYFSVLFGEAQRILNFEWDRDLTLIHAITQHTHGQINGALQPIAAAVPVNWAIVAERLVLVASELATFFETPTDKVDHDELCQILGRIAELAFIVNGNGSYLYDKGAIKFQDSNAS